MLSINISAAFHFVSSSIDTLNMINWSNIQNSVLSIEKSIVKSISNSVFTSNGLKVSSNIQNNPSRNNNMEIKGIIYNKNSNYIYYFYHLGNTTISNWTFTSNASTYGGALYYTWPSPNYWVNSAQSLVMTSNSANVSGGAIYYDVFRPDMK